MNLKRIVCLMALLLVVSCGKDEGRNSDDPGDKSGEWTRIDGPCRAGSKINMFVQDENNWLSGCSVTRNPSELGLFRTSDQGASWSSVEGWEETYVHSITLMKDGKTLLISGQLGALERGDSRESERVWSADINDAKLTPTLVFAAKTGPGLRFAGVNVTAVPADDGTIYLHGVYTNEVMKGTLGGEFTSHKHGLKASGLTMMGDVLAAEIDEIATENLDILLQNREEGGDFWERVTVFNDPEFTRVASYRMNSIDGAHYITGFKMPDVTPLLLVNKDDPYEKADWKEVELPEEILGNGIGGISNIAVRGSTQVLVGETATQPATSWISVSEDGWATATRTGMPEQLSLPDMGRQLGDSSVMLDHVRIFKDGTILAWGRDEGKVSGKTREAGGYIVRLKK